MTDQPWFVVRSATTGDLEALVDLFAAVVDERLWLGAEPPLDGAAQRRRFVERMDEDSSAESLVAVTVDGVLEGSRPTPGRLLRPQPIVRRETFSMRTFILTLTRSWPDFTPGLGKSPPLQCRAPIRTPVPEVVWVQTVSYAGNTP